jgi:glutathione synthase/RimK-type ligase-like ATP-grasp enzyme
MITAILRKRKLGKVSCEAVQKFIKEKFNKDIFVIRNDISQNLPDRVDLLIRWGCTSEFPYKSDSYITINDSKSIHAVGDKAESRKIMQENNISVPISFFNKKEITDYFCNTGLCNTDFDIPLLIGRPRTHHQGRNIAQINNLDELDNDNISEYWSEFIDKDREFRVFVFFGKVIAVAEKIPTDKTKIAWNKFGKGSSFVNVKWKEWPIEVCKEALKSSQLFNIDFCGVDVMLAYDKPYILEINSAHSLSSEYRQNCFTKAVNWLIDYVEENNEKPDNFVLDEIVTCYKQLIHPCMVENEDN